MIAPSVRGFVAFLTAFLALWRPAGARSEDIDVIIDPEELKNFTLPNLHLYENWADWESWEAGADVRKSFPYYRSGYDEDGFVIYAMEFGKWNYRALAHMPAEEIEEFWMYYEQYARRAERDAALHNGEGTCILVDWDGFSLQHYAAGPALQAAMKMFTFFARFTDAINYAFFINVNFAAETFMNIAKPYFADMLEKTEIYGTLSETWKPKLLRRIPANQLPPVYGGTKDWKPLPFK